MSISLIILHDWAKGNDERPAIVVPFKINGRVRYRRAAVLAALRGTRRFKRNKAAEDRVLPNRKHLTFTLKPDRSRYRVETCQPDFTKVPGEFIAKERQSDGIRHDAKWRRIGPSVDYCLTTGGNITHQQNPHRFVSTQTGTARPVLFADLLRKHRRNRRKHNHPEPYYLAHNARNAHSNPRNNLRRRILRILATPGLFDAKRTLQLTPEQKQLLDYWKGSPYDLGL